MMSVSVIIPTKNRSDDLVNTIKTVFYQTCLPDEMIIVDQNDSADIKEMVLKLYQDLRSKDEIKTCLKYIHDPAVSGLTQARNRAIRENNSDIVVFLDDDVILEKDFIEQIIAVYLQRSDVYGVSGVITNIHNTKIGRMLHKLFYIGNFRDDRHIVFNNPDLMKRDCIEVSTLPGGLTSYKKEVFREFSFDEQLVKYALSEDLDFSFRVSRKYKLVIAPKARLQHVVSSESRVDMAKGCESLVLAYHYFASKNLEKSVYNCLCYFWLNTGFFMAGLIAAIFKADMDMLRGYTRGWIKILRSEKGDFIRVTDRDGI
jgi:GT2 family glycosyltransferase